MKSFFLLLNEVLKSIGDFLTWIRIRIPQLFKSGSGYNQSGSTSLDITVHRKTPGAVAVANELFGSGQRAFGSNQTTFSYSESVAATKSFGRYKN